MSVGRGVSVGRGIDVGAWVPVGSGGGVEADEQEETRKMQSAKSRTRVVVGCDIVGF